MMNRHKRIPLTSAALSALMLMAAWPVTASASADPLIEGARQCTQYFPVEEKKNSIPTHLLAAIATTESGRFHKGLGMNVPWPWTINVEGKGYFFNSKAEAIAQVQNLQGRGYQSIDVGCMQVNLKHHPKAFADLNAAFDPATNVSYAARFLHDNYASLGDWIKATAAYHSRTPVYGQRYLGQIENSWNRIVGKVAEARASKAGVTAQAGGPATKASVTPEGGPKVAAQPKVVAEIKPRVVNTTRNAMAEPRRARVIRVTDAAEQRKHSQVLVVNKPVTLSPEPIVRIADASPVLAAAPLPVPQPEPARYTGDSVRRVSLDKLPASGVAVGSASPNFVFAN